MSSQGVVLIEGERITCAGSASDCPVPAGARLQDLSGHFITPGLIDAHVHFAQTGWLDGRPDGVEAPDVYPYDQTISALRADPGRWHRAYLCSGVTAVFDVGGAAWTVTGPQATDTDRPDRVHVKAAGPLITHASERNRNFQRGEQQEPMFLPFDSDEQLAAGIAQVKAIGGQALKIWFLKPKPERQAELEARLMLAGKLAREAGLPLIVHATELAGAKAALRAGAAMLVHSVMDAPVDQEFLDLLAANDAVYAPTLVVMRGWSRAIASVAFAAPVEIDDPNGCVDAPILDRIQHPGRLRDALGGRRTATAIMANLEGVGATNLIMAGNLRAVYEAGGRIVVATDAGNPLTVHGPSINWEMEAMQAAGMPAEAILVAATSSGASALGMETEIGSLEAGKQADLIVLADDPRTDVAHFRGLTHVMRKGVLSEQAALRVR